MRIERLDLLRFGRFTDSFIDFPKTQSDVHVVYGPNEAGKSTSLAAIEDLLFGIPHNSRYNFLHDYADMRVGGVLRHGGEALELRRRKGNKDTILAPDETPLSSGESVLARLLGGADQSFFTRMFSLNHERLARGGREILEAKDEVGQTLFAAGSGVAGLHDQIAALAKEADGLWGARRAAHRKYYKALDALEEADKALREHTVTSSKWYEAKRALDGAEEKCAELETEIESRVAEQRKLTRIRRIYRSVCKLFELREEDDNLGDVKLLPDDAGERVEKARRDEANARSKIEELNRQLGHAKSERTELVCDEALLRRTDDIQQLHKQRIEVQKERADLPRRRAELDAAQSRLRILAGELGWDGDDIGGVLSRLPPRAKIAAARGLLTVRGGKNSAIDAAKKALAELKVEHRELKRAHDEGETGLDISILAAAIRAAQQLGDIGSRIREADNAVKEHEAAIEKALKSLRPQPDSEQALVETPAPPRMVVQEHRDASHQLREKLRACDDRISAAEKEAAMRQKAYADMARDDGVVPPEELAQGRERRDLGWSLVRRRYIEGSAISEEEMTAFDAGGAGLPEAYEEAVAMADHLADRRFETAQAAGEMAAMARQIEEQQEKIDALRQERLEFERQERDLDLKWTEIWCEAPFEPLAPDHMVSWLDGRKDLLEAIGRRDHARSQAATLRDEEADARKPIFDELTALGEDTTVLGDKPLRVVLEAAAAVRQRHDKLAENRATLEAGLRKLDADQDRKSASLEEVEEAWREWEGEWRAALKALELEGTASPETVADQLDTIEEMRGVARDIEQLRNDRIGKIERDIKNFADTVERLVSAVATDVGANEPDAAVVELETRLAEASRIHDKQAEKDKAIALLEKRVEECEAAIREARDTLRELQDISDVEDIDSLNDAIIKSRRKRDLAKEAEELEKTIAEEGDGLPLPDLSAECEGADLDEVAARDETLQTELNDFRSRLTEAAESRVTVRQAFKAIGGDDRAARAAAARQEALASMRDCAEQFVRVRTSAVLLQWAIDRYRREKQTPLLKLAGKMFATLTSHSFSDLRVEYDDQDNAHLAGVRPDGKTVGVDGMSDGTADQLYLALRLASVDEYLGGGHVLPFVADDLFINFDNARAAAGFDVLAELGRKTQILFFTHHRHLIDIAAARLGQSVNIVILGEDEATVAA